jgi:heme-degrading monooxygenase HmoA
MSAKGELYAVDIWQVKTGREQDFISTWSAFTQWTLRTQPGAGQAYLLQDPAQPARFLSVSPWQSAEALHRWRDHSAFGAFVTQAQGLCDELQTQTLRLAATVPP